MSLSSIDELFDLYRKRGASVYHGEAVTQLEHASQCAYLARRDGADEAFIVAAFLHDVGHLLLSDADSRGPDSMDPDAIGEEHGSDARHEGRGAAAVSALLGESVAGPIRLHVAAKRQLCAVDPLYGQQLSPASVASLAAQGGPFDENESARFVSSEHAENALRLRRWDDLAKDPDARRAGRTLDLDEVLVLARRASSPLH